MKDDLAAISPFDIAKNIYEKTGELSSDDLKKYNPFMMNRIMSNNQDTIFFANEMNQRWEMSAEMQYAFYYYGVDKRKRYGKWYKKSVGELWKIDLIKEYYGYSELKARELIPLLDELDVWNEMKEKVFKGGSRKR